MLAKAMVAARLRPERRRSLRAVPVYVSGAEGAEGAKRVSLLKNV